MSAHDIKQLLIETLYPLNELFEEDPRLLRSFLNRMNSVLMDNETPFEYLCDDEEVFLHDYNNECNIVMPDHFR